MTETTDIKARIRAKILSGEIAPRLALFQPAMPDDYTIDFVDGGYIWRLRGEPGVGSWRAEPGPVVRHAWEHLLCVSAARLSPGHADLMAMPEAIAEVAAPTPEVARVVDRSKPPPGYIVDGAQWQHVESGHWGIAGTEEVEHLGAEASATAAWAHHEQHHDPPGCHEIFNCALGMEAHGRVRRGWKFRFGIASDEVGYADMPAARAAAWAWYWRRVAVSVRLSAGMWAPLTCECSKPPASWGGRGASLCEHVAERLRIRTTDFWPRLLACPDDQFAEVERWLVDSTAEMPEVLRG